MTPASVFVVPVSAPTDATHFTSLAEALTAAGDNGTVTLQAGITADSTQPVTVTQTGVTIQGDLAISAYFNPPQDLTISANNVTLRNLFLGDVTIGAGFGGTQLLNSTVNTVVGTAAPAGTTPTVNTIAFNRILGSVTLAGNGTAGSSGDLVQWNVFTGTVPLATGATALLNLNDDTNAVVQFNSFGNGGTFGPGGALGQKAGGFSDTRAVSILAPLPGQASPVSGIAITSTDATALTGVVVQGNIITLQAPDLTTFGISVTTGTAPAAVRILNNSITTATGTGLQITAGDNQATQVFVQGNNFAGNAIGVAYAGPATGTGTIGTDLGGGSLSSTGNNLFTSFTTNASATNAAISVTGVPAAAALFARNNVFAVANPSTVIFSPSNVDATSPLTGDLAYVQSLYVSILGRTGSTTELQFWASFLSSNGVSTGQEGRNAVINGILNSQESAFRIINQIYVDCLGRTADSFGLSFWASVIQTSSLEQAIAGIVSSVEWQQKNPGTPVEVYYENQLHRPAGSADELGFWEAVLQASNLQAVPRGIVASQEFRQGFALNVVLQMLNRQVPVSQVPALVNNTSLNLLQLEASLFALSPFTGAV